MRRFFQICIIVFISIFACYSCKDSLDPNAEYIWVPGIFDNQMVLQQGQENLLWGKATPGSNLSISIHGFHEIVKVGSDSAWKVKLPVLDAGGPFSLIIAGKDSIVIEDVLAGEVWLASGQSNMAYAMSSLGDYYASEMLNDHNDRIRFLTVGKTSSTVLKDDIETDGWKSANRENIPDFSAVAYFLAKEIYKEYKVPVGIINSSYGGTSIEQWINQEGLKKFPVYDSIFTNVKNFPGTEELIRENQKQWSLQIQNDFDYHRIDESEWKTIDAPEYFETRAYPQTDGLFWLKRTFELPEGINEQAALMHLGTIDDVDATFVNDQFIGNGTWWDQLRTYKVDGSFLKSGKNEIAIAVADFASNGGFGGKPEQMKILFNNDSIPLTGKWECTFVTANGGFPAFPFSGKGSVPTGLYNGMISPVLDYGMKGVIWYQGEANTGNSYRAKEYARLFPSLILGWRENKGNSEWPFIFVQLPNYSPRKNNSSDSEWALLRESQLKTLNVNNTAMVVTIDIGDPNDVHPRNKKEVGERLFLAAENAAYGKELVFSGPVFDSLETDNDKIKLFFKHVGSGLITNDNKGPEGFIIAGSDSVFYQADYSSIVSSNMVIISSSKVKNPIHVRYAWADNPKCNLFNKEGLPASPFRTDDF